MKLTKNKDLEAFYYHTHQLYMLDICRLARKQTLYWFHVQDLGLNLAEGSKFLKPRRYSFLNHVTYQPCHVL